MGEKKICMYVWVCVEEGFGGLCVKECVIVCVRMGFVYVCAGYKESVWVCV